MRNSDGRLCHFCGWCGYEMSWVTPIIELRLALGLGSVSTFLSWIFLG